jgi:hypothetical protein
MGQCLAVSDGKDHLYFSGNVGIKERNPQEALHVNGSILIDDGTQAHNRILRTDANGLASWVDVSTIPGLSGNNSSYNHILVNNGFFQDAYLNGTTSVNSTLNFPSIPDRYILAIANDGTSYWTPNNGASGTNFDTHWLESFNTLFIKNNSGDSSVAIGSNNLASAEIILHKNGGAHFNTTQIASEDFNVGSDQSFFKIKVDSGEDQVGIGIGNPDTRLDVKGIFGLRAGLGDYTFTPDNQSSVYWVAQNSAMGNNGDVLARISALGQDKLFKLVDFLGTTNGVKTQNGITLNDLTPNRLVATDASKRLVSENNLIIGNNGYVGIGTTNPKASLEVGSTELDFVDGTDDLSIRGDLEADGTIYASEFVGDTIGLFFNGVTIRNAKIYTSTIYEILSFNGNSYINSPIDPLYFDANLEFKGNSSYKAGSKFELYGKPEPFPTIAFHAFNGRIGINNTNPGAELDINGRLMLRDGSQRNGYVVRAFDSIGNTRWEFIDTQNVAHALNVDNATTANFTNSMINANIVNSTFTNGIINGSTLTNVDLTNTNRASKWIEGPQGLYPINFATKNAIVGGTNLASSTVSLESNGTLRAIKFVGDFSNVTNITYNQEWNDQGNFMFPFDFSGNKGILIGGNTLATADTIFNADGSVIINEQAQNSDTRVEGQTHTFLFHTDASANRVSIKTANPRSTLEINGSTAYVSNLVSVGVVTGLTSSAIQNSRVIFVQSSGPCDVDLTASPQIATGVDGQIITLIGRYSDEIITLDDGDGLALNNNISVSLKAKDSITLMYSSIAGEWIEIHRTNYLERIGDSLNRGTCT